MLKTLKIMTLLCLLLISSCKKQQNEPYTRPDNLVIGDYTNTLRQIFDTVIVYQGFPASIDLDMDNDQVDDVRLISTNWGSVGLGHHPRSEIWCLTNNVSISGFYTTDTTFFSFDQSSYIGNDSIVNIDEYYRYSCHTISDQDSVVNIASGVYKISVKSEHDKINKLDMFKTDSLVLIDDSYSFPPFTIYKQDTVIQKYEYVYNNCSTFPQDDVHYIGIRIVKGNEVKYGWIKLSVIDINKIIIYETTVQK